MKSSPQQQRILVLDGDPALVRLVSDRLDRAGFDVFSAASGQQALEVIAQRGLSHLAIIDINVPGMDGFEFCQAVQQFADLAVDFTHQQAIPGGQPVPPFQLKLKSSISSCAMAAEPSPPAFSCAACGPWKRVSPHPPPTPKDGAYAPPGSLHRHRTGRGLQI